MARITVNAGHGMKNSGVLDPGAIGAGGLKEYIQADQVGQILKGLFINAGWQVQYLQDGDLWDVSESSDKWGADYFISIHCNAVADRSANGIETYYQAAGGMAEKIAKAVQTELVAATGLRNRGAKIKNLHVTRETNAPAILVEAGFVSNLTEEKLMNQDSFDRKVAESIFKGFMKAIGHKVDLEVEKPAIPSGANITPFNGGYGWIESLPDRIIIHYDAYTYLCLWKDGRVSVHAKNKQTREI